MPVEAARREALQSMPNTHEAAAAVVQLQRECERNIEAIRSLAAIGDAQAINALSLIERHAAAK